MATLVFTSKHSVLAGTLTVTVNYSVSQGGDSYTLTVPSIVAKADSYRAWHNVHPSSSTLSYDGAKATIAANSSKTWTVSKTKVVQKTHSAQSVPVYFAIGSKESGDTYETGAYATLTLSVPAKTTYKVTLNANGGTGGTASLTKWHGETLSLTSGFTAPTRTGYRFIGWGTSSTATTTQATYTANAATTLYAVWEKLITGITLDVTTLRVTDGTSTAEDDEGTWCYGTCAYSITGPAAADVTFTVSATPNTPQIVQNTFTATKAEDNTLNGSFVFRASGCATDASYTFMVGATVQNTSATQTVTKSQGNVLSMAYYVLDVLGDNYVSSGQRPAHGISFGAPCKTEGFHVAMPADFSDGLNVVGDIETPGGSITPVVLYDNDSTALNVAITLSETAANFRRLTICYKTNDNDYSSVEVWHPNGKTVSLTATRTAGNSTTPTLWLKSKTVLISGTTINTAYSNYYLTSQTRADGNQAAMQGDYIAITQVIGYR